MPKISVIVPVYNTEKYLHRCIDSILSQTFTDFELLLINDGSKDNSGKICDEYASRDSRIRVFHKENGGVSSARNLGLDNAQGEWIAFVDSDDWVESHYLSVLFQDGKYDFVTCYWRLVNDDSYKCEIPKEEEYNGKSEIRKYLDLNIAKISFPVCRLYRKEIISTYKLSFNEKIHCSEDALFNITYLKYVDSIKQVSNIAYNYEKHIGSLSRIFIPWKDMNYTINMLGTQISQLEEAWSWNGERLYQYHIWAVLLRKYLTHLQFHVSFRECRKGLREILKNEYVRQCFASTDICKKSKSRLLLDFFMRNEMLLFAALFLKAEYVLLKMNIVNRL